jgi:hypothetical protein
MKNIFGCKNQGLVIEALLACKVHQSAGKKSQGRKSQYRSNHPAPCRADT